MLHDRWRGRRRAGSALVIALACGLIAGSVASARDRAVVVVTDDDGLALARLALDGGQGFSLRYRNSLYGTLAEEHFVVHGGGFRLDKLTAQQLAVLEEYYTVSGAPRRTVTGWWQAPPEDEVELERLTVAATDLGQRTLLVAGHPPVDLWRLVRDDRPSVHIEIVGGP